MNRWTTIVVAALLFIAAPSAGLALAQRPTERPAEPGRGPQTERAQPERAIERAPRPADDLDELRREVQRLRSRLEQLQNERGVERRAPEQPRHERLGPGSRGLRGGAVRERMQDLRERADRNKDGRIDEAERGAAREALRRRARVMREVGGQRPLLDARRDRVMQERQRAPQRPQGR